MAGWNLTEQDRDWLAARFDQQRTHLRAVGYRMLGSLSEADDAVQEAWVRLSRSEVSEIENLGGWLTTVVARVCVNMLQNRRVRREEPTVRVPDPTASLATASDPEQAALLADSVGLALQVVLDTLSPAERLALVLHDIFGVSFDEIAPIIDETSSAARQLASRARRRVQGRAPTPDSELDRQREVVDAFLAASREGNFDALLELLDPDVLLRADSGALPPPATTEVRGAEPVAHLAAAFSQLAGEARPALVNGAPGLLTTTPRGEPYAVMGFTISNGRIVQIDILADAERLGRLDLLVLGD